MRDDLAKTFGRAFKFFAVVTGCLMIMSYFEIVQMALSTWESVRLYLCLGLTLSFGTFFWILKR